MKRSNRLVLLIGIFLALVAFILVAITLQGQAAQPGQPVAPTTTKVVVAARDLPMGTRLTLDAVALREIAIDAKPADSFGDPSLVVGKTARQTVTAGQLITSVVIEGAGGQVGSIEVPAGLRRHLGQGDPGDGRGHHRPARATTSTSSRASPPTRCR